MIMFFFAIRGVLLDYQKGTWQGHDVTGRVLAGNDFTPHGISIDFGDTFSQERLKKCTFQVLWTFAREAQDESSNRHYGGDEALRVCNDRGLCASHSADDAIRVDLMKRNA